MRGTVLEEGKRASSGRSVRIKLGVILDGAGTTADGWRRPGVQPDASVDLAAYVAQSQRAEAALLDFVFIADSLAITADAAPHLLNRLEPMTLLAAVAAATSRIGLVATVSALYSEPFTVARQLASLDLISHGRAAWNVVTSAVPAAALNHSRAADFGARDRYRRAAEHVEACLGLWDSWEPDAFVHDKASGRFFDRDKLHAVNFSGRYFQVAGPLNIQGSKQGRPVIFQAGASGQGRDLAARYGDAIFAMASDMQAARDYSDDVKSRAAGFGRARDDLVFMPRISPIIGRTEAEVDALYREATQLARIEDALSALSIFMHGHDFTRHALDAPFPELEPGSGALQSDASRVDTLAYIETTDRESFLHRVMQQGLSLREAALQFMTPRTAFMGTPDAVAATMEHWFRSGAADGFIIRGGDFAAFAEYCIPTLQERGLFRTQYEADTLRGNLGLPWPANRHAARRDTASATSPEAQAGG